MRELRNEAARVALRLAPGEAVALRHLSPAVAAAADAPDEPAVELTAGDTLDSRLGRFERELLRVALVESDGSLSAAARRLAISRGQLRRRLRDLAL